ncbi:LuxR family transcriptional regulator [Dyadobacter beijingensis]|uniref:LuxR family transcriptional regulator n=1 Tax=Dyadobacter beijingensis TaxID=365489 RepID=A0ABQ2I3K0_9BACT|nr:AAA family ATPase [Dyadobacter beijingensis]GGM97071.1 LuxR family transcriptional regulator [Dyadobacter beijingensis]
MELIERSDFLSELNHRFEETINGEGHCILVSGEAGIGKSTLVKAFCDPRKADSHIFKGTCDALYTPRPLAPLYDMLWQLGNTALSAQAHAGNRSELFGNFLIEVKKLTRPVTLIFEDIHWADEATLDFIKFLSRRITDLQFLLILTYRSDEIHSRHPLRSLLGQFVTGTFSRLELSPLSRQAVAGLAAKRGYRGEDVFSISGGNPFYVTEILASYSIGIPENIKDSILSVCQRQSEETRRIWELLSVSPTGLELRYLEQLAPGYAAFIERSLDAKIVLLIDDKLYFKHELYRRTIESSISPFAHMALNKRILALLLEEPEPVTQRIIHHAELAREYELMLKYIPLAAGQAIRVGAHLEAAKLFCTAITHYKGIDQDYLTYLHQSYAYECYLTNQTREAIIHQEILLPVFEAQNDPEKLGDCLRFLSRLWWFEGSRSEAERYGFRAVQVLEREPDSIVKAQVYSNISQLKMLSHEPYECMVWGQLAITMAKQLNDLETLSHALNNVGTVQMEMPDLAAVGMGVLQQSLQIALEGSYHEHAARAYTNLSASLIRLRDFGNAEHILQEGLTYCEKRDLDSWTNYMLSLKARMRLETGAWDDACEIATELLANEEQPAVVTIGPMVVLGTVKMRRNEPGALPLLTRAKTKALETMELQRIIPAFTALLEYQWLTGESILQATELEKTMEMTQKMGSMYEIQEFCFWLKKYSDHDTDFTGIYDAYVASNFSPAKSYSQTANFSNCPYEEALTLFDGDETGKTQAIRAMQHLGAAATYEKLKYLMRAEGLKRIPRGMRKSTTANSANLTLREVDVLQLLNEGLRNKEIASRLSVSTKTVDHHISSLLLKLNVDSRAKAVQQAMKMALLK